VFIVSHHEVDREAIPEGMEEMKEANRIGPT
jgi:hypothetical protein